MGRARGVFLSVAREQADPTRWHGLNKGVHSWPGRSPSRVPLALFAMAPPHSKEILLERQPRDQKPALSLDNRRRKNFLALATTGTAVAGSSGDTAQSGPGYVIHSDTPGQTGGMWGLFPHA